MKNSFLTALAALAFLGSSSSAFAAPPTCEDKPRPSCNGDGDSGSGKGTFIRADFLDTAFTRVHSDGHSCKDFDYWDARDSELEMEPGCKLGGESGESNASGGGRWLLRNVTREIDSVEAFRWLVVDLSNPLPAEDGGGPDDCYQLDNTIYLNGDDPAYGPTFPDNPDDMCLNNLAVLMWADRILKANATRQQLDFTIVSRPWAGNPYWSPAARIDYINPLYLLPATGTVCEDELHESAIMTTFGPNGAPDVDVAELALFTGGPGANKLEVIGLYHLPLEVCVVRAAEIP